MAVKLVKGQKISLRKQSGETLTSFCVGANWGAIEAYVKVMEGGFLGFGQKEVERKKVINVDLDLSVLMLNGNGDVVDHIYSPEYNSRFLNQVGLPKGKLASRDYALKHSGDDMEGDIGGDDGLDNEVITVDLSKVSSEIQQIFFFLNNVGKEDFAQIPFAKIRMYEGTPTRVKQIQATYDVVSDGRYSHHRAMVMGKLYRHNAEWKFQAIGDPTTDAHIGETIGRILTQYAK
ncbi:TerD family protein [Flammeovirga aprica]|uniref:TerD family protein n=1 Tax=Flammeovirga aprica JL-4 TaxID=694437 RepID=A0A7X9RWY0_9BACT|nr:TerD family protein [Flammeovirga aprica]NME70119.1 TerD family protein [Flammeovirga aprica JL-4]